MTDTNTTTATLLGITPGQVVRLIGGTPDVEAALAPLPDRVTMTSLGSEPAGVGIIVVDDENDLRERLFTELNGLLGASHVWVFSRTGTGPAFDAISAEADLVAWRATTQESVSGSWSAIRLEQH